VRGHGLDMVTDKSRSWSGHGLDAAIFADTLRKWTVRGHGQNIITVADWMRARTGRGHKRGYPVEFPGRCREIARLLRGRGAETVWRLTGYVPAVARILRGHCPEVARKLPGDLTGNRADAAPETTPDGARPLRGSCAAIRRKFCEHRRLKNLRGEASTLKPAQNCVGTSVGIYLRN